MHPRRVAGWLGVVTATLVAIASIGGIFWPAAYARETESWRVQGMAQDWIDLVVAAPWLAVAAVLTLRGSRRGALLLGGAFVYTAYAFVIYAFAVHFSALFLVYVATLGSAAFGLADLGAGLSHEHVRGWFGDRAPRRVAAVAMMGLAGLFALLWLAQIVPAIAAGTDPPQLAEVGLVTNPVHVLDLALVLPLFFVAGWLLRQRRDLGYVLGAFLLGFSVLMDLAILAMTVGLRSRGLASDDVIAVIFAAMTIVFGALLVRFLAAIGPRARPAR